MHFHAMCMFMNINLDIKYIYIHAYKSYYDINKIREHCAKENKNILSQKYYIEPFEDFEALTKYIATSLLGVNNNNQIKRSMPTPKMQ